MRIIKEANEDWLYMQLQMFLDGELSAKNIKDDLIYEVKPNGVITLKFEYEDYFSLFGFNDYSVSSLVRLYSYYSTYTFYDGYRATEDWEEGYVYEMFNTENKELVEEIKQVININLDLSEEEDRFLFFKLLKETFNRNIANILDEYESHLNSSIESVIKKEVKDSLCDIFMGDGIYNTGSSCFYTYYTTVKNLLKIYNYFDDKSSNLKEILTKLGESKDLYDPQIDDYYDYNYAADFDYESFNEYVKRELDDIHEKLWDSDIFIDVKEYSKIHRYLNNKFKFLNWYRVPRNEKISFKITGVEPSTNYVVFDVRYSPDIKPRDIVKEKASFEDFNLFLYHPKLF